MLYNNGVKEKAGFSRNVKRKGANDMAITKDIFIGDILDVKPDAAPYFLAMGMHCLHCPSARGETLAEACAVHGVDVEDLLAKLNG